MAVIVTCASFGLSHVEASELVQAELAYQCTSEHVLRFAMTARSSMPVLA